MVHVYRNLHKDLFSIRDSKSMKVIDYQPKVILEGCSFVIQESGRKRALRFKQRNVHAFIKGNLIESISNIHDIREITYNYRLYDSFIYRDTLEPITKADIVLCEYPKCWVIIC